MRNALLPLACVLALAGCDSAERAGTGSAAGSQRVAPATGDGRVEPGEIRAAALREHLSALQRIADEAGGDRAAGTDGERATISYVAEQLREAGWRVRLETVSFPFFDERAPPRIRSAGGPPLSAGDDFRTLSYSGSGRVDAAVRRVGRGCRRADFAALGEGEVAVAARGDCFFRTKARHAEAAGAAALLIVDTGRGEPPSATLGAPGAEIPVLALRSDAGRALGPRVQVSLDAISERRRTHNVIAETTGGRRGVAMAGAHLDSVPAGPGINDNGSGVAALLEVAAALGGRAPGARIRLGFWAAEELGLIGSRRHVARLGRAERRRIAAYVNLDMIGSPTPRRAVYSDGDPGLKRLLRRLVGRRAEGESASVSSDHAPFARAGIPIGGLFTGAGRPHDPCYHRGCDDLDNANARILTEMARTTGEALERLSRQAGPDELRR